MLAQSFKSAAELEITERQKDALQKTLALLETGKLQHVPMSEVRINYFTHPEPNRYFNMMNSFSLADCGSVACIRGTAMLTCDVDFDPLRIPNGLADLFYSGLAICRDANTDQAASALRSYLITGDAKWHEAVA